MTASFIAAFAFRTICANVIPGMVRDRTEMIHALLNYSMGALMAAINVIFMRYKEITNGVKLQNKDGTKNYFDKRSRVAGRKGVFQTMLSRLLLPHFLLEYPFLGSYFSVHYGYFLNKMCLENIIRYPLHLLSILLTLPVSLSIFNQRASIKRDKIDRSLQSEKEFGTL